LAQYEATSIESTQFFGHLSARKHVKNSLSKAGRFIQSLTGHIRRRDAIISSRLEAISLYEGFPKPVVSQLDRLQKIEESLSQSIHIISQVNKLAHDRNNTFEDRTLVDNKYALSLSTVDDLVAARRPILTGWSRHFGGQVTDKSVQKS
ncbi:hypothetical protein BDP55DRAFT_523960, partial [Colletotrichum godetiae]